MIPVAGASAGVRIAILGYGLAALLTATGLAIAIDPLDLQPRIAQFDSVSAAEPVEHQAGEGAAHWDLGTRCRAAH